jgi:hypothetical protein
MNSKGRFTVLVPAGFSHLPAEAGGINFVIVTTP